MLMGAADFCLLFLSTNKESWVLGLGVYPLGSFWGDPRRLRRIFFSLLQLRPCIYSKRSAEDYIKVKNSLISVLLF